MKFIIDIHAEADVPEVEEKDITPEAIEDYKKRLENDLGLPDESVKHTITVKVVK
jgi:hypothetical protein